MSSEPGPVAPMVVEEPTTVDSLPVELLHHIFCCVPPQLLPSTVCRRWAACAKSEELWREHCHTHRKDKHDRFALTPELECTIAGEPSFSGWRKEFERAERDSDRDQFLPGELSSLCFQFTLKSNGQITSGFSFEDSGLVSGHPSGHAFPWAFDLNKRAIVIGEHYSPFPTLFASRESNWTWRLENRNVVLTELESRDHVRDHGGHAALEVQTVPATSEAAIPSLDVPGAARGEGHAVDHNSDLDDIVAVLVGGEVFYLSAEEAADSDGALQVVG